MSKETRYGGRMEHGRGEGGRRKAGNRTPWCQVETHCLTPGAAKVVGRGRTPDIAERSNPQEC